jgi:nucleoside-diphosphate-sugar epimerase
MKIVVTGATGFLGTHLCHHLHRLGHEILALGRDRQKGAALAATGISFEAVDLGRISEVSRWQAADAMVHAAALSSAWGARRDFELANVIGTRNALDMACRLAVKRFVFISSPSVGFRFRDQLDLVETAPLPLPVNAYAATKAMAEDLVRASGLNTIILRPRGLYGKGDAALLPRLIRAAVTRPLPLLRKGAAVTDLTHIDDVVAAIVLSIEAPPLFGGRTYNISGGEALTIRKIIEETAQAAGVTVRFQPVPVLLALAAARGGEYAARWRAGQPEPVITAYGVGVLAFSQTLDLTAARKDLGYCPQVDFAEGLRRTFAA